MRVKEKNLSYKIRKKIRENIPLKLHQQTFSPRTILHFSKNNIFLNIICRLQTDPFLYATIFWLSCGSQKFSKPQYKGSSKVSYIANYTLGSLVAQKLCFLKFKSRIFLGFKGSGVYFNVFLRALKTNYRRFFNLIDLTPVSLNGCRLKKVRRV